MKATPTRSALGAFALAFTLSLTLASPPAAQAVETSPSFGSSLPELLLWAEQHSPVLKASQYEAQARQQQIISAGALEDPMFAIEWMNIPKDNLSLDPRKAGEMKYTLRQAFPLWGKLDLKEKAARSGADAASLMSQNVRNQLRSDIRSAYATWYRASAIQRINRQQLDLLRLMDASASQRYAVGKAPQSESLRIQTEMSMLENEALQLELITRQSQATLAALLNVAPNTLQGTPTSLPAPQHEGRDWQALARSRNPELLVAQKEQEASGYQLELAGKNKLPGLNVSASAYQMGSEVTSYGLMLEFQIPLQQGAKNAEQAEALAMQQRAKSAEVAKLRSLEAEIGQMQAMFDNTSQQLALLEQTLLPQAELTLQSALASYGAGRGEFTALLEAQQQIKRLRQMRLMAEVDHFLALNALTRLAGDEQ